MAPAIRRPPGFPLTPNSTSSTPVLCPPPPEGGGCRLALRWLNGGTAQPCRTGPPHSRAGPTSPAAPLTTRRAKSGSRPGSAGPGEGTWRIRFLNEGKEAGLTVNPTRWLHRHHQHPLPVASSSGRWCATVVGRRPECSRVGEHSSRTGRRFHLLCPTSNKPSKPCFLL